MSDQRFPGTVQTGMRIAAMSIFGYDYLITIPSEIRLYRRQVSWRSPSIGCILFVAARYVGLFYIILVTVIFFSRRFSTEGCDRIAPAGAFFRGLASTIAALIFMWRTWAIWNKRRRILIIMGTVMIPATFFSYASAFRQRGVVDSFGTCTAVAGADDSLSLKWPFAAVNLIYDTLAVVLGSIPLIRNIRLAHSPISSILLADGMGYFIVAVIAQTLNLAFLLSSDPAKQGTFMTFQTVVTMIAAQRILTSLWERTSTIYSSRDWERSQSKPPASVGFWFSPSTRRSGDPTRRSLGSAGRPPAASVEMIKVDVDTHTHVDDESAFNFDSEREDSKAGKSLPVPERSWKGDAV